MGTVTRRKEVAIAAVIAVVTTAVVALAKGVGSDIVAAFIAGAGSTATVGYVVLTNIAIEQARRSLARPAAAAQPNCWAANIDKKIDST